jgi:hypothetical protein
MIALIASHHQYTINTPSTHKQHTSNTQAIHKQYTSNTQAIHNQRSFLLMKHDAAAGTGSWI